MVQVGVVMFSITRTTYNAVSVRGSRRPRYNGAAVYFPCEVEPFTESRDKRILTELSALKVHLFPLR